MICHTIVSAILASRILSYILMIFLIIFSPIDLQLVMSHRKLKHTEQKVHAIVRQIAQLNICSLCVFVLCPEISSISYYHGEKNTDENVPCLLISIDLTIFRQKCKIVFEFKCKLKKKKDSNALGKMVG